MAGGSIVGSVCASSGWARRRRPLPVVLLTEAVTSFGCIGADCSVVRLGGALIGSQLMGSGTVVDTGTVGEGHVKRCVSSISRVAVHVVVHVRGCAPRGALVSGAHNVPVGTSLRTLRGVSARHAGLGCTVTAVGACLNVTDLALKLRGIVAQITGSAGGDFCGASIRLDDVCLTSADAC